MTDADSNYEETTYSPGSRVPLTVKVGSDVEVAGCVTDRVSLVSLYQTPGNSETLSIVFVSLSGRLWVSPLQFRSLL